MASVTKPRAPIAAMYSSPGPCYNLPSLTGCEKHDSRSVHVKKPAYSFGIRHKAFSEGYSPGPCYRLDSKIYRDGKDGTPHYSLYKRNADVKMFNTPGAGTYSPEKSMHATKNSAPVYSMRTRHVVRRVDDIPAPNCYDLDPMVGKTVRSGKPTYPSYCFGMKSKIGSFHDDLAQTPGPATYKDTTLNGYKSKAPAYSLTARNAMPGDSTQKPGPGAHSPENTRCNKRQAPQFSFGVKHSEYVAPLIVCEDA